MLGLKPVRRESLLKNKFLDVLNVYRFVQHMDVVLFEHFQVLRGGVRSDDTGWNFIIEFFP